ncbi:hypothetical protein Tco_0739384 [Tanacetum coccineum]
MVCVIKHIPNDEYIFSDVNPLFNEVLEDIESEDSYVSKLDEPDLLVTPLSKLNEDECFDPGGDFDDYYDSEGDIIYLESLLIKDTIPNLHPEVFLDDDPRSLEDEHDKDDLKSIVKDCSDFEDSRAHGFDIGSLRSSNLSMFIYGESRYPRSY